MFSLPGATSIAIGSIDALIAIAYVTATTVFGILLGRGQVNNRDYFLAGHRLPTWSLLLSIVATETSSVTFLSVPGKSFVEGGNFTFLQIAFGYILGRLAIVAWLLPGYFRGEILSAYEVLQRRYGVSTRRLASLVFLVMRNMADGLRLFLTALALNVAIGLDIVTCIWVMTIATAIYACAGGVRSVVWNDCIQFAVYMLGAAAAVWVLISLLPGGWHQLSEFAVSTGRAKMFDFDPTLSKKSVTFWSGLIGGAVLSLATHGVDQMMVQRYLCAKDRASAGWALGISGFVVFAQFALFLLIGMGLACFNETVADGSLGTAGDTAFMKFVANHMQVGLKGLILAAVLAATMSNLASSFNSSASSMMSDWLGRWTPGMSDSKSLLLARVLTLISAIIHAIVAVIAYKMSVTDSTVDAVLKIAGFSFGLILGLYALGLIAPRISEAAALIAFTGGTIITSLVVFGIPIAHWLDSVAGNGVFFDYLIDTLKFVGSLSGWWYTLVGSSAIVVIGLVLGTFMRPRDLVPETA